MAAVIFENMARAEKKKIKVSSAGTHTMDGLPMTDTARMALIECGEKLGKKVRSSTRFKPDMIKKFDHIVTMTHEHALRIGEHPNVYPLDNAVGCGDIPDPFMQPLPVYINCCKTLQDALRELYSRIVM